MWGAVLFFVAIRVTNVSNFGDFPLFIIKNDQIFNKKINYLSLSEILSIVD